MQLPGKNSRIFLARIEWTAGNSCPHQKDLQGRNPPTRLKSLSADPAKAEQRTPSRVCREIETLLDHSMLNISWLIRIM